jgi:hypothetical protein
MEHQPTNIKPNGPEEIASLVMVKTILELQGDELLKMARTARNEGRAIVANIGYSLHALIVDVLILVQASIDNDFDAMNNILANVGELEIRLQDGSEQFHHDMLQEVLNALCSDNSNLARYLWLISLKMIKDARSGGLDLSAFPKP